MKKVLISGYIGYDNFGDEAIFKALTSHLLNLGYEISVLSNKSYKNIKSYKRLSILSTILNCDILISGGGSLLQNKTSNLSLLYYLFIILIAISNLIFIVSLIHDLRFITKNILKTCDFISTRDNKSTNLLKSWGIEAYTLSDPVYSILPEINKNKSGLIVQLRECANNILDELAISIKNNYEGKINVLAFQKCDEEICQKFVDKLKEFGISSDCLYNKDVDEILNLLNGAKYVISTRLHGLMASNALQARVFALSYDDKTDTVIEEFELENIDIRNPENLNEKLAKFFTNENKNKEYRHFSFNKLDEVMSEF